jgi:hypothetical protein
MIKKAVKDMDFIKAAFLLPRSWPKVMTIEQYREYIFEKKQKGKEARK